MEVKIRAAMELDIIRLITLAEDYVEEATRWGDLRFDPDRAVAIAAFALLDPMQQIFIAYKGTEIHGFAWVGIEAPIWSKDLVAYDHFLYVPKKYRNLTTAKLLVGEFERWAKVCGAKVAHLGSNSGIRSDDPAAALYKHLGYSKGGANFYKVF